MNEEQVSLLLKSAALFPPPHGVKLSYGTAGFRADASLLQSAVFRVGILAALRSFKTQSVIGLMITASHNKVTDNGVKVADPNGGMLSQDWEPFADKLVNASTPQLLVSFIVEFIKKENIQLVGKLSAEVWLGRDTRPSGESLIEVAKEGINSIIGAAVLDFGVLTTPQLHWMIRARSKGWKATEQNYFEQLSSSFRCLMDLTPNGIKVNVEDDKLIVDGANGVGGEKLEILNSMLNNLAIEVRNCGNDRGILNEGVGADYVQKEKLIPRGFGSKDVGKRCASLDGDADRLVYFSVLSDLSNEVDLVDGDKILSLFAIFVTEQLSILYKGADPETHSSYQARVGVVQTAYANGASTDYLKQSSGLEVVLTPTGVKFLHEKAALYDIGIYFEANGHGTILFSDGFLSWLEAKNNELASISEGSEEQKAAMRLLAVSRLINQAVGDALSGLLLVESILQYKGWSVHKWAGLYEDLPSRQLKVKVVDRTAVVTENAQTVVVRPLGIQDAIIAETAKYPRGRSFIRPSGTEDVIRVYAEASTQEAVDNLANSVAMLVDRYLGYGSS
uniref:Phosphoacetylglucosamine mutase n=2 Tax=Carica papaya TaxID=3649 RepID=A7L4A6_CARPA|nr:phosphoglucosamine mutase [Carica papaya]